MICVLIAQKYSSNSDRIYRDPIVIILCQAHNHKVKFDVLLIVDTIMNGSLIDSRTYFIE